MICHRFEVAIFVEDDDQTDPEEFLADHIEGVLKARWEKENEEFGTNWPIDTKVEYLRSTHTYVAPIKEEANGSEGNEDHEPKKG